MEDGAEQNNTGTEASDEYDDSLDYNIASEKLSKEVLNQLRNNDPKVTSLEVSFGGTLYNNNHICANTVDWEKEGRYISENKHIKYLFICGSVSTNEQDIDNCKVFYRAVACNTSIRHLFLKECCFDMGEMLTILMPFFDRNSNSLVTLELNNFQDCGGYKRVDLLINALSKCTSLQRFGFKPDDLNQSVRFYDDESTSKLITELVRHRNLRKLTLTICNLDLRIDLRQLLPRIKKLEDFSLYSNFDDVEAKCLCRALGGSKGIKALHIEGNSDISAVGWGAISRYISISSTLVTLALCAFDEPGIDDESLRILGVGIARTHSRLKELSILSSDCTSDGWVTFFDRLIDSNLNLERLDLSYNYTINDNAVASMVSWLSNMTSLETLIMDSCHDGATIIDDDADDDDVTSLGWISLTNLLQNPDSRLGHLDIKYNPNINDQVLISYANALVNNTTLEHLYFDNTEITITGYIALANVLCNKSSKETIHTSNHTLQGLFLFRFESSSSQFVSRDDAHELESLLQLNKNENKVEVVRQKILRYHFCNGSNNIEEFVDMDLGIMPHAISWIGKNEAGLSLLYKLCESMPSLFDSESKAKASQEEAKNKRHQA